MTGMPSSFAFLTAGRIASESMARIMRTLAPFEIKLSTSVNCFVGEACASAEMYLAPDGARAALIAASSVFQRSSWKLDQDTPTTMSLAAAAKDIKLVEASSATPKTIVFADFIIASLAALVLCRAPYTRLPHPALTRSLARHKV